MSGVMVYEEDDGEAVTRLSVKSTESGVYLIQNINGATMGFMHVPHDRIPALIAALSPAHIEVTEGMAAAAMNAYRWQRGPVDLDDMRNIIKAALSVGQGA